MLPIKNKNKAAIEKFLRWDEKYNHIVDKTEDSGGFLQEQAYDKASEAWEALPKYEQKNLSKNMDATGY